jgi:hypothetical protein
MIEAEHLTTLRADARHHVPDGTVLSHRVHRLKDKENGVTVVA